MTACSSRGELTHWSAPVATIDLVVMDLAGTTIRDDTQIATALLQALREQRVRVTPRQISALRGMSKQEAIACLLPRGLDHAFRCEAAFASFREHVLAAYRETPPQTIPGALAAVEYLRTRNIRVALTTGLSRDITEEILRSAGWPSKLCDAVVCGDEVPMGRPAPYLIFKAMQSTGVIDVHRVVSVGDSTNDLLAGFNARVGWNVGVLSGVHDRATLRMCPHTELLESIAELPAFVERSWRTRRDGSGR